ncbi:FAD-dependent oxidoreductase domain-containing protein 2-like [Saccoglossus kowalevskii]|uniref:FAD-dependent oxidoreductase domain-containing protein 2-like n=1 Tax=Saccoglossus kowalevskii TaxID=10224 RepID=A0ABM0GVQ2_SACKO|nr:PREDICTED: FAD-dependent oxidoreductase domain-containing protein 2-like [Saccoglossus kowalevskii]
MESDKTHYEYIVIGAGPGGVQMAYFMEKAKMDYLVLERADGPGSFFRTQPRHRTLISINKKYNVFPEAEFNLRHDWNSLINNEEDNPLLFTSYTDKLFPNADMLVEYIEDFCKKYPTNIRYNTNVTVVHRDDMTDDHQSKSKFTLTVNNGSQLTCRVLLIATGAALPDDPVIPGIELVDTYENHSLDKELYKNKKVCILGGGNSAFEVGDYLADTAGLIHLFNRHPVKFSWDTHFVGHLRAVNNNIVDMYHLKSLHALRKCEATRIWKTEDGKYNIEYDMHLPNWDPPGTGRFVTVGYDKIIACTGWKFVNVTMFDDSCKPETHQHGKYPVLDEHWQSTVKDMYFAGTPMQSRDRRAASGFIHGFRYNIRTMCHMLRLTYNKIELPRKTFSPIDQEEICKWVIKHVSVVSALYQLGQGFLCDVMLVSPQEGTTPQETGTTPGKVEYIHELPQAWIRTQDWFLEAPLAILISIEDTIDKYPELKAPEFFTPADANVSNCKCSPFPQAVFRVYKKGKLVDDLFIGGSLVVRADTRNFEGDTNPDRYANKLRNLFHRHTGIGKGGYYEQLFTPDMWPKVYRPWTKEEIKEQRKTEVEKANKKYECSLSIIQHNQVDIADM